MKRKIQNGSFRTNNGNDQRTLFSSRKAIVVSPKDHTMNRALPSYIDLKIHHLLKENSYKKINVVGKLNRKNGVISKQEKSGKIENWQRPTASIKGEEITIECFPGLFYVQQNAALIASFLSIRHDDPQKVTCQVPTEEECCEAILQVGLESIPVSDWLVIGAGLTEFDRGGLWQQNEFITWSQQYYKNTSVTFLMCHFNFWADIIERVTRYLVNLGHQRIIYTAKVGGLNNKLLPNKYLATGSTTVLHGRLWQWQNIFEDVHDPQLFFGSHLNSAITLQENNNWLKFHQHFDFVDSEIGHFVAGAENARVRSYLHFVSNNLSKYFDQNLSNERSPQIIKLRSNLSKKIGKIIWDTITK